MRRLHRRQAGRQPTNGERASTDPHARGSHPREADQLLASDHFGYQTQPARFFSLDDPPRQQQVASALLADLPDQKDRNQCGDEADTHLGVAELRLVRGKGKVAQSGDGTSNVHLR